MELRMSDSKLDNIAGFIGGSTVGGLTGIKLWFLEIVPLSFPMEFALKLFATILVSFVGGIFGMLAKDFYTNVIKTKLFKNK